MSVARNRLSDLWNRQGKRQSGRRQRRADRVLRTAGEQLEPRAMLTASAAYYDDFTSFDPTGAPSGAWSNGNTAHGALVITLDGSSGSDDVYMRVINGNYQFSTTPGFAAADLVPITAPAYLAPDNPPTFPFLPGAGTVTIGTQIASTFSRQYALQTSNQPSPLPTPLATNTARFTSTFSTILVRTVNMIDGDDTPSFTLIGSSQTVTKSLLVDLNDSATNTPISGSSIVIGAPVAITESGLTIGPTLVGGTVATIAGFATPTGPAMPAASPSGVFPGGPLPEGSVLLRGESITVSSSGISVNAGQPIYMVSQRGASSALNAGGVNINSRISTAGDFNAEVIGTAFNINAGGQVSNGASGLAASVIVDATDADVFIPGKVLATDQYYFMQASQEASPDVKARMISTRPGGTGIQSGLLTANELIVYLANENDDTPAPGVDGVVDLQTSTNKLRITSATASGGGPLDNVITVKNNKNLTVDAVAASSGDISLSTSAGTIDLQAAINTVGSFSLAAFDTLTVDSAISSAEDISLTSTNGGVTVAAAVQTANSGTLQGKVTITGKNDVKIDSLVNAEYEGVTVTSQTGKIFSSVNLALSPTSRVTSPSTKLTAATGIDLGTDVGVIDAAVTGTGALTIDDSGASGYAAFLTVNSASTASGNVTIKSVQAVDVVSLVAGGTGDASITSTGGDINLAGTVIADGNAVTLTAAKFAADGVNVLNSGFITGTALIANEINWTAKNVVDDATRNAITASDYIGATATFETTDAVADGDLFYFTGPATAVPEGFSLGTAYYVVNSVLGAPNTFELALTPGGLAEGGLADLAGPIDLEPGNTDLYRNIPVVSAYRLSAGGINFTADNSTTLKAIKTTDGDVNVTSAGGSIVATSVVATAGASAGDVVLDARNGGVTLGSVATTSAAGTVSVFASQAIADDGTAATTGITANTINLSAATGGVASDIGSATNRVTVAGVSTGIPVALTIARAPIANYPGALDASSVYIGASSGLGLNAAAVNLVDVKATGAATDVDVQTVALSDEDGKAVLFAGRDLTVGDVSVAAGAFGEFSSISLEAGGRLVNANGVGADTTLEAHALTLKASTFDGSFDVTNLNTFERLTAAATAAGGGVNFKFDRAKPLTLDGITTLGGNIAISNVAVALDPDNDASLRVGVGGITAGTASSANTVTLTTKGTAISGPTDSAEATGTIFAASSVTLTAADEITAVTKAGQLVAAADSSIEIVQTGNTKIGSGGLTTKTGGSEQITLAVAGSILSGTGKITTDVATVSATTGLDIKTNVGTLSATAAAGNVTVVEDDGLEVGAAGITAASGAVSLTLTKGTLTGGGPAIKGNSVGLILQEAGNSINVDTSASSITASTKAGGNITIRNDKSFGIGAAGIVVGNPAFDVVALSTSNGAITGGTGSVKADAVFLSATTGITANTSANSLSAETAAGNIALTQTGKAVALDSLVASNGGITVTNNDHIAVTQVQAIGSGKNVALTASGVNKKITFGAGAITADGDSVSLLSTGGLDGTSAGTVADITAASVTLGSSGGDVTATVKATTIKAGADGTDTNTGKASNVDLTVLGSKPLFVGTTTGLTLGAAGNVTLRAFADPAQKLDFDPGPPVKYGYEGVPIIVVVSPTVGGTVNYETNKTVTFAVTTAAATGSGSLSAALDASSKAKVYKDVDLSLAGTTGVGFSSTLTSPIQLASTIAITNPTTLDGTQRLNLATGTLVAGRAVDIDGSRLGGTNINGFALSGAADDSVIRGFAFYGFNKAGGAAVSLAPSADRVKIQNNLFGISLGGRVSANTFGILATGAVNDLGITGNTVVSSTEAGIRLGTNVTNATITGNLIGTNSARAAMGNKVGIDLNGAVGTTIGGVDALANVIANNGIRFTGPDLAGIRVTNTTGTTTIRGNEILQNARGILINGTSSDVTVAGNTVTRNTNDGIIVNGSSSNVTIGGASAADRNFIGTTARNALGLGNARNGVLVTSTGVDNIVQNNVILGNGTANVPGENVGVKVNGNTASGVTITGNTINANRGAGILAARTGGGVVTITTNAISSNSGSGVQANAGAYVVVGSLAGVAFNDPTLRSNANTINSNARYGVEVLAGAFGQIAGNSMASNRLGGILNAALTAPTVTAATRSAANGTLTVTIGGVANDQVVDVYTGTDQGRVYLGRVVATGPTATFTMTLAQQNAAGVSAAVFVGAPITATRSTTGVNGQTSRFSAVRSIRRV
jgi:hypothetical protein